MSFQHEVFISYCSADREWAQKLQHSLSQFAPPKSAFFDAKSLRAGDDWENTIQTALENSQNLIVVWSDKARQSDWVSRELFGFLAMAKPAKNPNRRLLCLNLEGLNQATKSYQQIGPSGLQDAYKNGAAVSADVWSGVVSDIRRGLDPARRDMPVPVVALTATRDQLESLSADRRARISNHLGIDLNDLLHLYGPSRYDWKPFAGDKTLDDVLTELESVVNQSLSTLRLQWLRPKDTFWNDIAPAMDYVQNEFDTSEMSVLIVDPVAVYEPDVYQRLMLFKDCLASNRRVIVTLPPFSAPQTLRRLRDALTAGGATPYFEDYFKPNVPPRRALAAHCGLNACDTEEIRRLIVAAIGQHVSAAAPPAAPASPYISHGAGG